MSILQKIFKKFGYLPESDFLELESKLRKEAEDRILKLKNTYDLKPTSKFHVLGSELLTAVKQNIKCTSDCHFMFGDTHMVTTTLDIMKDILKTCASDRLKYVVEERDCEDFSRIVRGWISEQGFGNLSLGEIHIQRQQADLSWYAHSMLVFVDVKKNVYLIEPQSGLILSKANFDLAIQGVSGIEAYYVNF